MINIKEGGNTSNILAKEQLPNRKYNYEYMKKKTINKFKTCHTAWKNNQEIGVNHDSQIRSLNSIIKDNYNEMMVMI